MKQPKLPGVEKFKFATLNRSDSNERSLSTSEASGLGTDTSPVLSSRRAFSCSHSEISPALSVSSITTLHRSDSKKRAVLPITRKRTSRLLTNTDLDGNMEHADVLFENAETLSRLQMDSSRVPSCPNLETTARNLNISTAMLEKYHRKMSLQNSSIRDIPPDFDWKNIRASMSRLSASCSSSCSSEENIWVLRGKP